MLLQVQGACASCVGPPDPCSASEAPPDVAVNCFPVCGGFASDVLEARSRICAHSRCIGAGRLMRLQQRAGRAGLRHAAQGQAAGRPSPVRGACVIRRHRTLNHQTFFDMVTFGPVSTTITCTACVHSCTTWLLSTLQVYLHGGSAQAPDLLSPGFSIFGGTAAAAAAIAPPSTSQSGAAGSGTSAAVPVAADAAVNTTTALWPGVAFASASAGALMTGAWVH